MSHEKLIEALQHPAAYDHPVEKVKLIETHLSWVLLTGQYAYKIKKPVDFEFVDYTTLEKRFHYCKEELRLNQKLAPQVYLDVVPITGSVSQPKMNGTGPVLEYAVRMREFSQANLLNQLSDTQLLNEEIIKTIAKDMANFHDHAAVCSQNLAYWSPEELWKPVQQNFDQVLPLLKDSTDIAHIQALQQWTSAEYQKIYPILDYRKKNGFIRECHGDFHLGNIVMIDGKPVTFDCIEFNEEFRWIDVIADMSFLAMDLENHELPKLANTLTNAYMQQTGDYQGLLTLKFYQCYRAMVRAKVTLFHLQQKNLEPKETQRLRLRYESCIALALTYTKPSQSGLIITQGVSCSGKSTLASFVAKNLNAIHVRSDIERKRIYQMDAMDRTPQHLVGKMYSDKATERTYSRLLEMSKMLLPAGFVVIADATFLLKNYRQAFFDLAKQLNTAFVILHTRAPQAFLFRWIVERSQALNDPSEADLEVLKKQLQTQEPLSAEEESHTIAVDTSEYSNPAELQWLVDAVQKALV